MRPYQYLTTDPLTRAESSLASPAPRRAMARLYIALLPNATATLIQQPLLIIDSSRDYASAPTQYGSEQFAPSVLQVLVGYF